MKPKICVIGSAEKMEFNIAKLAREIGREIARQGAILITGATTGYSNEAAIGAHEEKGLVIGISPAAGENSHKREYCLPTENFDAIIYTGFGYKGRNLVNIRAADAVIMVSGGIGTLNEATIAYDAGKNIGVLKGSGGVADNIKTIMELCYQKTKSKIMYGSNPKKLVKRILEELK